jgi:hypothetical protein
MKRIKGLGTLMSVEEFYEAMAPKGSPEKESPERRPEGIISQADLDGALIADLKAQLSESEATVERQTGELQEAARILRMTTDFLESLPMPFTQDEVMFLRDRIADMRLEDFLDNKGLVESVSEKLVAAYDHVDAALELSDELNPNEPTEESEETETPVAESQPDGFAGTDELSMEDILGSRGPESDPLDQNYPVLDSDLSDGTQDGY